MFEWWLVFDLKWNTDRACTSETSVKAQLETFHSLLFRLGRKACFAVSCFNLSRPGTLSQANELRPNTRRISSSTFVGKVYLNPATAIGSPQRKDWKNKCKSIPKTSRPNSRLELASESALRTPRINERIYLWHLLAMCTHANR